MSMQVTNAHRATFSSNMQLALQQKVSKLAAYAIPQSPSGDLFELTNLIGSALPQEHNTRHGDTTYNNVNITPRFMAKPPELFFADLVDRADRLQSLIDIQGAYTLTGAATIARSRDIRFLQAFYGTALQGKPTSLTSVPFAAANIVAVDVGAAGPTGMNIAKLREAQRIMRANLADLDMEECYMALTAEQIADLQSQVEVLSSDFNGNERPVLRDGKLIKLLGFNFIEMEFGNAGSVGAEVAALTVDGSGYRRVPAWCKSGMAFGEWEMRTSIDQLPQKMLSTQVFAGITCNASRTEEGKCVQVLCSEA